MKKVLVLFLLLCITLRPSNISEGTSRLSSEQVKTADYLAQMCIDNWDEYGVLPSVCIAQAFIESTLGKRCRGNNLWGICSGDRQYRSLEEGVLDYLRVINNGYYKGAPFKNRYKDQIRIIFNGGYCEGDPYYYDNAVWSIEHYNFDKYDKKLFKKLEERKRKKELKAKLEKEKREQKLREERARKARKEKQSKTFTVQYDNDTEIGKVKMNPNVVTSDSTVCMYTDFILTGIYDVQVSEDVPEDTIILNKFHSTAGRTSYYTNIDVYENVKG